MSISISESTQSNSESGHDSEHWDQESGVFPHRNMIGGKPSSTLLGQKFGDDGSMTSSRLRHNDSSSTLKSYYDRKNSPLAISQQTSASSARDLALRKGFPPVVQRSPLLQVDLADRFDEYSGKEKYVPEGNYEGEVSHDKSKKKPGKLDLSMLFPRSRKNGDKEASGSNTPSSILTNGSRNPVQPPESGRRKLQKAPSKESLRSNKNSLRPSRTHDSQTNRNSTHTDLYDHYEDQPIRTPRMDQIPESGVPERLDSRAQKDGRDDSRNAADSRQPIHVEAPVRPEREPFSWKHVRTSMIDPLPYNHSSGASISSHNTKTSRHTAGSQISQSDLKEKSVLSLSSDSEGDSGSDRAKPASTSSNNNLRIPQNNGRSSNRPTEHRRQASQASGRNHDHSTRNSHRTMKETPFRPIPEITSSSTRFSGPWQSQNDAYSSQSRSHDTQHPQRPSVQTSNKKERRTSNSSRTGKASSVASSVDRHVQAHVQQPTPPLSPNSVEFQLLQTQTRERNGRFMAVTKQEEALLEALRMKRARMREEIIEEHETAKTPSPPRIPERNASRYSNTSSTNTLRANDSTARGGKHMLLYLDHTGASEHEVQAGEPSPDLSDFLSFGGSTDENCTPRNSWQNGNLKKGGNGNGRARPDSVLSVHPATPPFTARISAVGYKDGRLLGDNLAKQRRNNGANGGGNGPAVVRFVDDGKGIGMGDQEYLLEDGEGDVIWGL